MFERADRYDLSEVGRYKMNQRLSLDKKKANRLLDKEDLIAIVREIIRLNKILTRKRMTSTISAIAV